MMNKARQEMLEQWKAIAAQSEYQIAIKAAIAAMMSYIAGYLFSLLLEHPNPSISTLWAVLSTFVVLHAHLGGTYRAAWVRFLGTAVGAFTGGLFTSLLGFHFITLGISIFLTVIICSLLNLKESIRIACMTTAVVMLLWGLRPTISPWTFGLFRFLDSAIGIIVAVIVAHAFWPAQAIVKLRLNLARVLLTLRRYFRLVLKISPEPKNYFAVSHRIAREVIKLLEQSRQFLEDSQLEILSKSNRIEEWSSMIDQMQKIFDAILVLENFRKDNLQEIFDEPLQKQLEATILQTDAGFQLLSRMLKEKTSVDFNELIQAKEQLNQDLMRFRSKRVTRDYDRADVEHFFVFFYNLRSIIEEILKMSKKIEEELETEKKEW